MIKNIILILLVLLVSLGGCKKTDEKIEEKIVGRWKLKVSSLGQKSPLLGVTPDNIPSEFSLTESGMFRKHQGRLNEWSIPCDTLAVTVVCSAEYYIEKSSLFILATVYNDGMSELKYYEIPIKKINNRKLKLLDNRIKGGTSEYTFIRQD